MASDQTGSNGGLAAVIIACEVAFWAALAGGLALRYLARRQRAGAIVLWCVPLIDVLLVLVVALDLRRGAEAGSIHGLAAMYLGVSVAFGPRMVQWADAWFAYRFAGGARPVKLRGAARVRREWADFVRLLIAAAIATGCLALMRYVIAEPGRTEALTNQFGGVGIAVVAWLIFGPIWTTFGEASRRGGE